MEAAWGKVAQDIGEDPGYVVAATHGKRAVDNLSHFKPHIKEHEMDNEVTKFEESILFFADAHRLHGPGSKFRGQSTQTPVVQTPIVSPNDSDSDITTPSLTRGPSPPLSIISSNDSDSNRFSFGHRLLNLLNFSKVSGDIHIQEFSHFDNDSSIDSLAENSDKCLEAWQLEAASVDRAIQILPGVKRIIDSIPAGRYAVATSGARTYGNFFYISHNLPTIKFSKPTDA